MAGVALAVLARSRAATGSRSSSRRPCPAAAAVVTEVRFGKVACSTRVWREEEARTRAFGRSYV